MALSSKLKRGIIAFVLFDLLLFGVLVFLYLAGSARETITELRDLGTTVYPEALDITEFELLDQTGKTFSEENFLGQWSLVFFGFTACPDICPLTMTELKQFYEGLDDNEIKQDLQIVLVTIDPARDNPQTMSDYVESFNTDFIGLSGDAETISALAANFYVAHSDPLTEDEATPHHGEAKDLQVDDYLIEHSVHISVVNPEGKFHAVMRAPHRDRDLTEAYKIIRNN